MRIKSLRKKIATLRVRANYFLSEKVPFRKGFFQGSNHNVKEDVHLRENSGKPYMLRQSSVGNGLATSQEVDLAFGWSLGIL